MSAESGELRLSRARRFDGRLRRFMEESFGGGFEESGFKENAFLDPACRPSRRFLLLDGKKIIASTFYRDADFRRFSGQRGAECVVSGKTAVASEARGKGMSAGLFRRLWRLLGKDSVRALIGFSSPLLYRKVYKRMGWRARYSSPGWLFVKKRQGPGGRMFSAFLTALNLLRMGVLPFPPSAVGRGGETRARLVRNPSAEDLRLLDDIHQTFCSSISGRFIARDARFWRYLCRTHQVFLFGECAGYAVLRTEKSVLRAREVAIVDAAAIPEAVRLIEDAAGGRTVEIFSSSALAFLVLKGYSLRRSRRFELIRFLPAFVRGLRPPGFTLEVEDAFLSERFRLGDSGPSLRCRIEDLEELLMGGCGSVIRAALRFSGDVGLVEKVLLLRKLAEENRITQAFLTEIENF